MNSISSPRCYDRNTTTQTCPLQYLRTAVKSQFCVHRVGFVDFASFEDAEAAHAKMQGEEIEGRNIKLDFASERGQGGGRGGGGGFRGSKLPFFFFILLVENTEL